jgi:hypothetical protein
MAALGRVVASLPNRAVLAYPRAVVAYGGENPGGVGFEGAAAGLARRLGSGAGRTA